MLLKNYVISNEERERNLIQEHYLTFQTSKISLFVRNDTLLIKPQ
jgi:hypothetical protein